MPKVEEETVDSAMVEEGAVEEEEEEKGTDLTIVMGEVTMIAMDSKQI